MSPTLITIAPSGCEALIQEALKLTKQGSAEQQQAGIGVLVNNAGIQRVHKTEEFPAAEWDAVIALNLSAVFL